MGLLYSKVFFGLLILVIIPKMSDIRGRKPLYLSLHSTMEFKSNKKGIQRIP